MTVLLVCILFRKLSPALKAISHFPGYSLLEFGGGNKSMNQEGKLRRDLWDSLEIGEEWI